MAYSELIDIAGDYPAATQDALLELAERYRRRNEREILELAAIAADIAIDDIINLGSQPDTNILELEPDTNPQLLEALRRYTDKDPDSLVGQSAEYLEGFKNGVKGIYFEVLVRDRLNAGETLGELKLALGQYARLGPPSEEGWDLEIIDRQGDLVDHLQLKATTYMSKVNEALRKYEHFRVVVPEEIDSTSYDIISTGIPHEDIEQPTTAQVEEWSGGKITGAQVEEWSEGAIADSLDDAAELVVDIIPVTSALVIVVIEGRRWLTGRATLKEATRSGGGRLALSTAYGGIGTALSAAGLGAAAIPVVMGIRLARSRLSGRINLQSNLETRTAELQFA